MEDKNFRNLARFIECSQKIVIGVGFKDLKEGKELYYNRKQKFLLASVFKIPVLIALYKQQELGKININSHYVIREEDIMRDTETQQGSGIIKELSPGIEMSIRDIAILMMTISDNNATDIIMRLVGSENIKKTLKDLDALDTQASVSTKDIVFSSIPEITGNNYSTPEDMVKILDSLYTKTYLTKESCEDIISIMKRCQTGLARIPKYLPIDVKVAHKTGTISGPINAINDSGIIFTRDRDYILSVFVSQYNIREEGISELNEFNKNIDEVEFSDITKEVVLQAEETIARISKHIFNFLMRK